MGERIRKVMVKGKTVDWDHDSSTDKAKAACVSKAKQGIHSLLPMSRQVFSHSQEIRVTSHTTAAWESKRHHSECPPLHSPSPALYAIWCGILLCGQLCWLSPPKFLCTPSLLAGGMEWEAGKALRLCKQGLAITKTSPCYQHCSQQNPKQSPILATLNQINFTPANTSPGYTIWHLWEWVFRFLL